MELGTAPFSGRMTSLALKKLIKTNHIELKDTSCDKWKIHRDLCQAKSCFGLSDRALAVLAGLLSFHPGNDLSSTENLIVFPSNRQLALRAHGMADATLRRHLASLVEAGLIARRDSPNGKRYARRSRRGEIASAFGFSLSPLLARASEIAEAAEQVRLDNQLLKATREQITLNRRDMTKIFEMIESEQLPVDVQALWTSFREIVDALPRRATQDELQPILVSLEDLRLKLTNALKSCMNSTQVSGNVSQTERQHSNSNTNYLIESDSISAVQNTNQKPRNDPSMKLDTDQIEEPAHSANEAKNQKWPLSFILKACPEILSYAPEGIRNWRDFQTITNQVRTYLGISSDLYRKAQEKLGIENIAIIIGCILQRSAAIANPGGYFQSLVQSRDARDFSSGPLLFAAMNTVRE